MHVPGGGWTLTSSPGLMPDIVEEMVEERERGRSSNSCTLWQTGMVERPVCPQSQPLVCACLPWIL